MSVLLYRFGRFAYRKPGAFILAWLVILGTVMGIAITRESQISSAITIDGTDSQRVIELLRTEFPDAAGGQGSIVFTAPEGGRLDEGERADAIRTANTLISANYFVVERNTEDLKKALPTSIEQAGESFEQLAGQPAAEAAPPSVTAPNDGNPSIPMPQDVGPDMRVSVDAAAQKKMIEDALLAQGMLAPGVQVSDDGSAALMQIQFTKPIEDLHESVLSRTIRIATDYGESAGLSVFPTESLKPHEPPLGGHEAFGLLIAGLVLFLTLGSLRAAGLPLVTAILGVAIGLGSAFALSQSIELTSATPVLALMIGLAVGIDYALFIVNRQRHLILRENLSAEEATGRSLGTAGSAVTFAGLIVVIALSGLLLVEISFLTTMALVAAVTVMLAVLIALTLLPAILGLIGERILNEKARNRQRKRTYEQRHGFAHKFATLIVKARWAVIVGVIVVLGVVAIPMTQMSLGMPDGTTANLSTSERQAADAITQTFGPGYNSPLISVVSASDGEALSQDNVQQINESLSEHEAIQEVRTMGLSPDSHLALFSVIPADGAQGQMTKDLVHTLRADGGTLTGLSGGSEIGVTGLTAANLDISEKLAAVLPIYLLIIVVFSIIILLVVFRSILIPIKATAGFLLTIGATFGIMTAVFQWGWFQNVVGVDTESPILSFLPIMVTGILYGLAMDYQVFLVSSMREAHVSGFENSDAVVHGFEQASRVVVAAAVIMVSVFAGFIFTDDSMVKQFGLALSVGILIDAFIVRIMLVPALMVVAGKLVWWTPRWLNRILPDLDIEGHRLAEYLSNGDGVVGQDR